MSFHGAKEGFNDIKALPDFRLESASILPYLMALAVFLLIAWLLWRFLSKPQGAVISEKPYDPFEIFEKELREIAFAEPRAYGSAVSCCLRKFLRNTVHIPVEEKTVFEIKRLLKPGLKKILPVLPAEQISQISTTVLEALQTSSAMMFSDTSEENFSSFDHKSFEEELLEGAKQFKYWLSKERERTRSVMSDAA